MLDKLADVQHGIWSHWMEYLFSVCQEYGDGNMVIPKEKVERWKRQMKTSYSELSEPEKDSDRNVAFDVLKVVQKEMM